MKTVRPMRRRQHGATIVEILVALTVSLILLGGVIQIFISNQRTAAIQEGLSRVQENARFASYFLSRDIREAGYQGCSIEGPITNTLNNASEADWDFGVPIEGYDDVGGTLPARLSGTGITPLPDTDVVLVRAPTGDPVQISKNNNSSQLFADDVGSGGRTCSSGDAYSGLCEEDVVMVADCRKARVFQITGLTPTSGSALELNVVHSGVSSISPGNAESSWGGASAPDDERFGEDSEIIRVNTAIYYLAQGTDGEPSLFRRVGGGAAEELVAGVEDMQISYGVDTDDDGLVDDYLTANDVSGSTPGSTAWQDDWETVMATRIALVLRSPDNGLLTDAQTFRFDGASVTAPDLRLRQVAEFTITLRNRAR